MELIEKVNKEGTISMDEIYEKLGNLKKEIYIGRIHCDKITYIIKLLEYGIETIGDIKNHPEVGKEELEIAVGFGESILYFAKSGSWGKNNERLRKKLNQLVVQLEQEVDSIKEMDLMNTIYTDLNEWVESLNICRFRDGHIKEEQYQTSYDLYVDLRKGFIDQSMSRKQELYIGKIVDQLDQGSTKLSEECKIEVSDYELSKLMGMIRENPRFNYRLQRDNSYKLETINQSIEREMKLSKRQVLEKRLQKLIIDHSVQ